MSEVPEKLTEQDLENAFNDPYLSTLAEYIKLRTDAVECYNTYADQQAEIEHLKIINADIVYAEYCLGCDGQSNDRARIIKQIADQQAEIKKQKQQIEYWQQLCREKGVEIIDKSALAAAEKTKEKFMSELPEKLEQGKTEPYRLFDASQEHPFMIGECDIPETAAEIVKRYNAYADQRPVIEQLVDACEAGKEIGSVLTMHKLQALGKCPDWLHKACGEIDIALAAAEKMKEKDERTAGKR